jgi:hydroxymethylbilane synthase
MSPRRVGTRGSALALWQAHYIRDLLVEADPDTPVEIEIIKTSGDRIQNRALAEIGGKGLFVKEIQQALMDETVDLAVHSLKDYPAENPGELTLGCVPARADRRDVLVCPVGGTEKQLPQRARIGTGSLRRQYQLGLLKPAWQPVNIRGNVDTRLKKVERGEIHAVVLAAAGLNRLGHSDRITRFFSTEEMVPAVGQGAVAVECRRRDRDLMRVLEYIQDPGARLEVDAERHFLKALGASCVTPVGCSVELRGDEAAVRAFLASFDGSRHFRGEIAGPASEAKALTDRLLERMDREGFER